MATPIADRADRHRILRWLAYQEVDPTGRIATVTAREAHLLWPCTTRARWNRTLSQLALAGLVVEVDDGYTLTDVGRQIARRLEAEASST